MIELAQGNLLEAPVEALVNTVNTEGIMGKAWHRLKEQHWDHSTTTGAGDAPAAVPADR